MKTDRLSNRKETKMSANKQDLNTVVTPALSEGFSHKIKKTTEKR